MSVEKVSGKVSGRHFVTFASTISQQQKSLKLTWKLKGFSKTEVRKI